MNTKTSSIKASPSFLDTLFFKPSIWWSLVYLNVFFIYLGILVVVSRYPISYGYLIAYLPMAYAISIFRSQRQEYIRKATAHRMPFFADALANSLSVGTTLEKALSQSSYYLKGEIKEDVEKLIIKCSLGKEIGEQLREIERKYPHTGFKYVTSLLDQYCELGVGISPILKKIASALSLKEEAEAKIHAMLSAGSSYAKMAVGVFGLLFLGMSYFMQDQLRTLLQPSLKPTFIFLIIWVVIGLTFVMRMTSVEFCRKMAIRPQIKHYLDQKRLSMVEMMRYSGVEWTNVGKTALLLLPALVGFVFSYALASRDDTFIEVIVAYTLTGTICWFGIQFVLKGMVEDQLIRSVEIFPDLLQVFIIGLNSGLNTYKAFEFAERSIRHNAPKILSEELCRTKFAMECGENHSETWQRLSAQLPFETVIDFAEVMVVAPMHGESIVESLVQMKKSYESKKLLAIEKTAVKMGQYVIPVVVVAFFPLFLFSVFAPLITRILDILGN